MLQYIYKQVLGINRSLTLCHNSGSVKDLGRIDDCFNLFNKNLAIDIVGHRLSISGLVGFVVFVSKFVNDNVDYWLKEMTIQSVFRFRRQFCDK